MKNLESGAFSERMHRKRGDIHLGRRISSEKKGAGQQRKKRGGDNAPVTRVNHTGSHNTVGSVSEVYIMRNKNKCTAARSGARESCARLNVSTRKHTRGISASISKGPYYRRAALSK